MASRTLWRSALVAAAVMCLSPLLRAATLTVTGTGDELDAHGSENGFLSLREAIASINGGSDFNNDASAHRTGTYGTSDTIQFSLTYPATITLGSALPSLSTSVAITGPGAANLTITGVDTYRVFFIDGGTVSISGLTVAHGKSVGGKGGTGVAGGGGGGAGLGGGVLVNTGTVTLTGMTFDSNSVTGGKGGSSGAIGFSSGGGGGGVDGNDGANADGPTGDGGAGGGGGAFLGTGGAGGVDGFCSGSVAGTGGDGAGGGGGTACLVATSVGANGGLFGGGGGNGSSTTGGTGGFGGGGGGNGPGGTLGGKGGSGFFQVGGGGGAGIGAALFIRSGAAVTLSDCVFSNNSSSGGSGGSGVANGSAGQGKGGAIFVMAGATATAACPVFFGNSASNAGSTLTDNNDVYGTITFTPDLTSVTVSPALTDYSDPVDLSATVTDLITPGNNPINTGTVTFYVNGVNVTTVSAPVVGGVATLTVANQTLSSSTGVYPDLAANTYTITAIYSGATGFCGSSNTANLTVSREAAVVTASASNPLAVKVNTPGGTAGPITLCADISDPGDDTTPGDISLAVPVQVTLTPVLGSGTYSHSIASGSVSSNTLHVCYAFPSVAVNVYDVNFTIGGNYYTGSSDSVLAVYDPSLGFTTGGGMIINPNTGNPANFGFNIKFQKKGSPQGSILYMEHNPDGTVTKAKSNSMQSLSIVQLSPTSWGAVFLTRNVVFNNVGGYSMQVTAIDDDTAGKNDQFGLKLINPGGTTNPTYTFLPQALIGGTIQVPHK